MKQVFADRERTVEGAAIGQGAVSDFGSVRTPVRLACLLLLLAYVGHCLIVNYVADDSFISFRYVKNLLAGYGLNYNPGERVEGYTNFLWVVVLAGAQRLLPDASLLTLAQSLGILFGGLSQLLMCRFSRRMLGISGFGGLLGAALLACNSSFVAWSTAGLETPMYALLVFAAAYAYLAHLQTGRGTAAVPLLFALAALTRPDGALFFAVTLVHATLVGARSDPRGWMKKMLLWGGLFSVVWLAYFVARFHYYGYLLPNTFYVKVGAGADQFVRGVRYLASYARTYGAFVFLPMLFPLLFRRRERWRDYFWMLTAGFGGYVAYVGGDGLGFHRFVSLIAPVLYLLVQDGLLQTHRWVRASPVGRRRVLLTAGSATAVVAALAFSARETLPALAAPQTVRWYEPQCGLRFPGDGKEHDYVWFDNYFVDRQAAAARWLQEHAPPGSVVAATPAGSIAYHMDHAVIDMLGLNDVHIAHTSVEAPGQGRAGHEKGDGAYVLSRRPDYILMGNVAVLPEPLDDRTMAEKLRLKSEHEIWADPRFWEEYELACVKLADEGPFRYFTFYRRKAR